MYESNSDLAAALKIQETVGRPRVEENQSDLLEVIKEIAVLVAQLMIDVAAKL